MRAFVDEVVLSLDQVDEFFADPQVQRLMALSASWEPLIICYPKEVQISRFMRWLLDPSEGHGLSDAAWKAMLLAAGRRDWTETGSHISLAGRRLLSASSVMTGGFSPSYVLAEVEVGEPGAKLRLDLLCVDVANKVYVAVENKFGAKAGPKQLLDYRTGLQPMFPSPGWFGVHLFLDSNEAEPNDDEWIPLGYHWLVTFLHECEERQATATHVRQTLTQFRRVLQDEGDESEEGDPLGDLVISIAAQHPDVVRAMRPWVKDGSTGRAKRLSELKNDASTNAGRARLRLYQIFCQRTDVWRRCVRQVEFAPFSDALSTTFGTHHCYPKRVRTVYSLPEWDVLANEDDFWFPLGVAVRVNDEQRYVVRSYLELASVDAERHSELMKIAQRLVADRGRRPSGKQDANVTTIARADGLTLAQARDELMNQMRALQRAFAAAV